MITSISLPFIDQLRLALRLGAADDELYAIKNTEGTLDLKVIGDIIVFSDNVVDLQNHCNADTNFTRIVFECDTFILDSNIIPGTWCGMNFVINSNHTICVMDTIFDVSAPMGKYADPPIMSEV